jgi:cytochrome c-type biogenesis protein CcmH
MQMPADMDEASRNEMVEGMVTSLAERLQDNPEDLKGWIMLIRSYATLNRAAEARTAFETALDVFEGDAEALALLRQNAETMLN